MAPPPFGTPRGIIWMEIWRTLHARRILLAPDAIRRLHGGFSPGEPRTPALRSGAEVSTDWTATALENATKECCSQGNFVF